ncbi:MAG: beta-lactamase family protein [Pseudonocardiales bacterium]|nr:beta-lactamase family protein [Pseudonocardiales bacterium]
MMAQSTGPILTAEPQYRPPLDLDFLSEMLSALAQKYQVPGAQLAIHLGGETVALEVGELQHGTGWPVTRDAAFPIGSITKTFTATVAMILVADGDLELDAPLGEYLPELGDLGNELTLRQVLSHTAGFAAEPGSQKVPTASIRRYVLDHCRRENMVLPPGTGFSYSSLGYVLVGYLVETITGMTWWDAMEALLLRPLGVEPEFVNAPGRRPPGRPLATGHSINTAFGRTRPVKQSLLPAEAPAGGLAVSAADLVTLGLMQIDDGMAALLPTAHAEQMRQAVPYAEPCGSANGWGLGLAVFGSESTPWVGHFGVLDGTDCNLRIDPFGGCIVAFTSNANPGGMWCDLVGELCTAGLPIVDWSCIEALKRPIAPPPGCAGIYLNGSSELLVSVTETGSLSLVVNGGAVQELILFEDLSFAIREQPSVRGRFTRDPNTGNIEYLHANLYATRRQPFANENGRCLVVARAALVS